jgi:hypothetical protein
MDKNRKLSKLTQLCHPSFVQSRMVVRSNKCVADAFRRRLLSSYISSDSLFTGEINCDVKLGGKFGSLSPCLLAIDLSDSVDEGL